MQLKSGRLTLTLMYVESMILSGGQAILNWIRADDRGLSPVQQQILEQAWNLTPREDVIRTLMPGIQQLGLSIENQAVLEMVVLPF